jgi:8-oxo-dGDP phosphatase
MEIKAVSSRVVYQNPWMTVREDKIVRPDGSRGIYGVVEKPAFATIAAYEDGGFHLVQQSRYPTGMRTWEFPQGTFDSDDAETVARAELAQETGMTADSMRYLGTLYNAPGLTAQACHSFLATGLIHGRPDRDPEEQDMIQQWVSINDFETMIRDGRTVEAVTLATYSLLRILDLADAPGSAPTNVT